MQNWSLPMVLEFDDVLARVKLDFEGREGEGEGVAAEREEEIIDGFAGVVWRTVHMRDEEVAEDLITQLAR